MRYVNMPQRSPEWLEWRKQGITATESGVILGISPYKTPWRLWAEKVGRAIPANLDHVPQVRYGREHEDHVRELFEQAHGEFVTPACAESDKHPLFRASFDGLTMDDLPVEIKCPGEGTLQDVLERKEQSDAYRLYSVQVQHQLLVSEAPYGWLVFYDGRNGEEKLIEFRIERDEALIRKIIEEGTRFWNDYIVPKKEPPMDLQRDVWFPQGDDIAVCTQVAHDYRALDEEVRSLSAKLTELKSRQASMKERIQALMGDHHLAEFAGLRVKKVVKAGAVNYEALLAAQGIDPALKEQFRKEPTVSWTFTPTERTAPEGVVSTEEELARIEAAASEEEFWNI